MSTQLTASQIRDLLKTRTHCLQAGFPATHPLIVTLNKIITEYVNRVGLSTYLSEMLGPVATVSTHKCTLYDRQGQPIAVDGQRCQQPLQRFIKEQFWPHNLPSKVEIQKDTPFKIEVRYL